MKQSLSCTCAVATFIVLVTSAHGSVDIHETVKAFLLGKEGVRLSGTASLVHQTWTKAVSEAEWLHDAKFPNDEQRQAFIAKYSTFGGFDLALKADRNTYELCRVAYDPRRTRKDLLPITADEAANCKTSDKFDALLQKGKVDCYAYDGARTVCLTWDRREGQVGRKLVTVVRDKVGIPEIWKFGVSNNPRAKTFVDRIEQGKFELAGYEEKGKVYATIKMPGPLGSLKLVIDPSKENSLFESEMAVGDAFLVKTTCSDYFQTPSGRWFPGLYRTEHYTQLSSKLTLTSVDEFRTISGAVDFDAPIQDDVFQVHHLGGSVVLDTRFSPPVEAVIPAEGDTFSETIEQPTSKPIKSSPEKD